MNAIRFLIPLLLSAALCPAAVLDPTAWSVTDNTGAPATAAADGKLETAWTSTGVQTTDVALNIDLGRRCWIHKLTLTPGRERSHYPRALCLLAGDTPDTLRPILQRRLPYDVLTSLRFDPVMARYWRLELAGRGAGYPWTVAETLLYGGTNPPAAPPHWVVVDQSAPDLLHLAAEELRDYVAELTGDPVTRRFSLPTAAISGLVFRIATPPPATAPLADPERASVTREENQFVFRGLTPRAVLGVTHAFLDAQGVRWLYPDALGDFVPTPPPGFLASNLQSAIDNRQSFTRRYANWNSERYASDRADYLWYYRNRWNASWGGPLNNRPGEPAPLKTPPFGYTHTFHELVPPETFTTHPEWFPLFRNPTWIPRIGLKNLGRRVPYDTTWGLNFCTSSTGVIDFVTQRILDTSAPATLDTIVWLVPMDACSWCECEACRANDAPDQQDSDQWKGGLAMSNRYFTFICAVADRLRQARPNLRIGAFAYEGYLQPPSKFPKLPDNVVVDVVQYGAYHLPLSAPPNRWMGEVMRGWAQRWDRGEHVGVYDWALLLSNARGMPVPMIDSLAERIALFNRMGIRRLGTQADAEPDVWRFNPWNFYAYSRLMVHPQLPADTVKREFFDGYYGRAGAAMRSYYDTLEGHWLAHNVDFGKSLEYKATPAAFPDAIVNQMALHLAQARADATTWIERQRVEDAATGFARVIDQLPP